jgi:calcium/calmodulin-dependent protein kinase IV
MDFFSSFCACFSPSPLEETKEPRNAKKHDNPDSIFNKYTFRRIIGEGGNGKVWKAKDILTGKVVAIKVADSATDDMAKEYAIMRQINSPHVLWPLHLFETKNSSFMVMPLYPDCLFENVMAKRMNGSALKNMVKQVATGLKAIHDAGYVHRDIKLENILQDSDGTYIIADFGLAEDMYNMTVKSAMGTPAYIAPEVAEGVVYPERGMLTVGKPLDIYAFGQMIYSSITGQFAMPASRSTKELIRNNRRFDMTHHIDELDVSADLKDLLYRMTDRNPISRLTIDEILEHHFLS